MYVPYVVKLNRCSACSAAHTFSYNLEAGGVPVAEVAWSEDVGSQVSEVGWHDAEAGISSVCPCGDYVPCI